MKKGRFLWSAHRITEKQKAGKARNIKEKQLKNSRNTDMVRQVGLADQFEIASAATSREEIWHGKGNPVYPPAKAELAAHGLSCDGKRARQLTVADYDYYDLLLAMDGSNVRNLHRMLGGDPQHKIKKLLDYAHGGDVADPWYSRDFARAYQDIATGCRALLTALTTK